jgi:hypothetical protein
VPGLELHLVDSDSLGLCPEDSRSLWLVIIPKSKDWLGSGHSGKFYNHEPIWIWPGVVCGRI